MIETFGLWYLNTEENRGFFLYCRNDLVPEVKQGYRILWSVSRSLDTDGVYRGAATLRGYYVKHPRPSFGIMPEKGR